MSPRKMIEIHCYNGLKRRVKAQVVGLLAVHRATDDTDKLRGRYQITHVPTGFGCVGHLSLQAAIKIVEEAAKPDSKFDVPADMPEITKEGMRSVLDLHRHVRTERRKSLALEEMPNG